MTGAGAWVLLGLAAVGLASPWAAVGVGLLLAGVWLAGSKPCAAMALLAQGVSVGILVGMVSSVMLGWRLARQHTGLRIPCRWSR